MLIASSGGDAKTLGEIGFGLRVERVAAAVRVDRIGRLNAAETLSANRRDRAGSGAVENPDATVAIGIRFAGANAVTVKTILGAGREFHRGRKSEVKRGLQIKIRDGLGKIDAAVVETSGARSA